MADQEYKKDHSVIDQIRDATGLYKLGFEWESFLGLSLPFVIFFVACVFGFLIWQFL